MGGEGATSWVSDTGGESGTAGGGRSCGSDVETRTGAVHDLTTVFTFRALQALEDPAVAIADARSWSDWVGMVGEAGVPRMHTFLRRQDIRVDFFNGASSPAARLQRVADTDSSFGSERLVLVGVAGQDHVAAPAEWEFQPLAATAAEAGWRLRGADG